MGDPLSIIGTAISIISLGIQVTQCLVDYYSAYQGQNTAATRAVKKLEGLTSILDALQTALQDRRVEHGDTDALQNVASSIEECEDIIDDLQTSYQKFSRNKDGRVTSSLQQVGRKLAYPFQERTLQKLEVDIDSLQSKLLLATDILHLRDSKRIQDDIGAVKSLLQAFRSTQLSSEVRDWLRAPDATIDHNEACAKRHPDTGSWFIQSKSFVSWSTDPKSFLWLNGFAGCGKSVLCSTAIQYALQHRRDVPKAGIAFFYFTFTDPSKQNASGLLRALLLQLAYQVPDGQEQLDRWRDSSQDASPSVPGLVDHFRQLLLQFDQVSVLLDAVDECPANISRAEVLNVIETIRGWSLPGLHLFVTSRDEYDIRDSFQPSANHEVRMNDPGIDSDISEYIAARLQQDRKLQKWQGCSDEIQKALSEGARGVFRWVDCQFQSLQSCPSSKRRLEQLLRQLPRSLDESYERMLRRIDEESIHEARRIFTLLCFAERPLEVREIIEGIAVDLRDEPYLEPDLRLDSFDDLVQICPGFIELALRPGYDDDEFTVHIAHFSVQEYLESDRIRQQKTHFFGLRQADAHAEIAKICIAYILEPGLTRGASWRYPLAHYASTFWHQHYLKASESEGLQKMVHRLLSQQSSNFGNWVRLSKNYNIGLEADSLNDNPAASGLYFASKLGLETVLAEMLKAEETDVNAIGGRYGTALGAAVSMGQKGIAQLLLTNGADVNAVVPDYGHILQLACFLRHKEIVQLLFDESTNVGVNSEGGRYGTALQAACANDNEAIIQLLFDKSAEIDVNLKGGYYGTALQAACHSGSEATVRLLLDKGADVNIKGGGYGSALQAACYRENATIIQILLDHGADINIDNTKSTPLHTACEHENEALIRLLLVNGADVHIEHGRGTVLQVACEEGREAIVRFLLDNSADLDVNHQGGFLGTALQAACCVGNEAIVRLLLEKGADVHVEGGRFGTAFQAACCDGNEAVVRLLLDRGADVHANGGKVGTALQAACLEGHEVIVQLLLDKGVEINVSGGDYGSALIAACTHHHDAIVRLLLDNGADIDLKGGYFGFALQAACYWGNVAIVHILLEHGADVNAVGGRYKTALGAARRQGETFIANLLLAYGAVEDVEIESKQDSVGDVETESK